MKRNERIDSMLARRGYTPFETTVQKKKYESPIYKNVIVETTNKSGVYVKGAPGWATKLPENQHSGTADRLEVEDEKKFFDKFFPAQ